MPRLSRWMLQVALLYLMTGLSLGLLMLLAKVRWLSPALWRLRPIHIECLQVGWMFHLALGVAYWIFPRINKTQRPRSELAWISFGVINIGIGLYCGSMIWFGPEWLPLARLLEFVALLLFAAHLVPRVKAFGTSTTAHRSSNQNKE